MIVRPPSLACVVLFGEGKAGCVGMRGNGRRKRGKSRSSSDGRTVCDQGWGGVLDLREEVWWQDGIRDGRYQTKSRGGGKETMENEYAVHQDIYFLWVEERRTPPKSRVGKVSW